MIAFYIEAFAKFSFSTILQDFCCSEDQASVHRRSCWPPTRPKLLFFNGFKKRTLSSGEAFLISSRKRSPPAASLNIPVSFGDPCGNLLRSKTDFEVFRNYIYIDIDERDVASDPRILLQADSDV